jgi:hypothetical protein
MKKLLMLYRLVQVKFSSTQIVLHGFGKQRSVADRELINGDMKISLNLKI